LDVPPGALESEVQIVIERIAVPAGYRASGGTAYRFLPEGLRFGAPVTVRFDLEDGEEDAEVYWSDEAPSTGVGVLATRIEDGRAVASIEHFSIGFVGWPVDMDGGLDAGSVSDASGVDGSAGDGGFDGGSDDAGELTGVTCVVSHRPSCSVMPVPETFSDVPFMLQPAELDVGRRMGLSSPLAGFRTLYNSSTPPIFDSDPEGSHFAVGDAPPSDGDIVRRGLRVDVDVHTSRDGGGCESGPPLIAIDCTGSTLVSVGACRDDPYPFDRLHEDPEPPSLVCTVRRRDTSCVAESPTLETPTASVAPGWFGVESEILLSSPALAEATGGDVRFYQEHPCTSYSTSVDVGSDPLLRDGAGIWLASLSRTNSTTCRDGLGESHPTLTVTCAGLGTLGAP
jgi:hypothetical protein